MTTVEPESLAQLEELSEPALERMLRGLVRIPSVNPGVGEAALAAHVARVLERSTAAALHVVETLPGRPSLAAVLADGAGTTLVLNGHLDTVPVDDESRWSAEPFRRRDARRSALRPGRL